MEMHQLRYVVAIARMRSFSRAAESCHVSQPSLSQQIQKLEEELGERLFDRTRREAKLTPHGQMFLRRAAAILEEVDAAQREATEAKELRSGTLRIGVLPTIAPYLLPDILVRFCPKFPGLEVVIQEETTAELTRQLLACELDLALASHPMEDKGLQLRELYDEELVLALPPGHRLLEQRRITVADLETERFIVMKEGHCLGDQVVSFCNRKDLRPQISFRSAQLETVQALVRSGLGVSLIPRMAVQQSGPDRPEYRSLAQDKPQRTLVAAWLKQRALGRAAEEFLKLTLAR